MCTHEKITCDVFNTGETIYFTIGRIAELEQLWGEPIFKAVQSGTMTFNQLITAFVVGMKQHGKSVIISITKINYKNCLTKARFNIAT